MKYLCKLLGTFCLKIYFVEQSYPCFDGDVRVVDTSDGYFCDGQQSITGIVSVCLNGSYVPVCNSGFSLQDAQTYCQNFYYDSSNASEYM